MSAFASFISGFLLSLIIKMANLIIDVIQGGYDGLIEYAVGVVGMFPTGPALPSLVSTPTGHTFAIFLTTLNWVFPVSYMLSMVQWMAQGFILYLLIAPVARLFKLLT